MYNTVSDSKVWGALQRSRQRHGEDQGVCCEIVSPRNGREAKHGRVNSHGVPPIDKELHATKDSGAAV